MRIDVHEMTESWPRDWTSFMAGVLNVVRLVECVNVSLIGAKVLVVCASLVGQGRKAVHYHSSSGEVGDSK